MVWASVCPLSYGKYSNQRLEMGEYRLLLLGDLPNVKKITAG